MSPRVGAAAAPTPRTRGSARSARSAQPSRSSAASTPSSFAKREAARADPGIERRHLRRERGRRALRQLRREVAARRVGQEASRTPARARACRGTRRRSCRRRRARSRARSRARCAGSGCATRATPTGSGTRAPLLKSSVASPQKRSRGRAIGRRRVGAFDRHGARGAGRGSPSHGVTPSLASRTASRRSRA